MVTITKITLLRIMMLSTNKSKWSTNINKCKNSTALAAENDSINFLSIDNSRLNLILLTWVSVDSLCCVSAELAISNRGLFFVRTMKILHLFVGKMLAFSFAFSSFPWLPRCMHFWSANFANVSRILIILI